MSSTVIKVSRLSKKYRIGVREKQSDTLLGKIGDLLKSPVSNFRRLKSMSKFGVDDESVHWALRDINFEVKEGEVLGIIGHNGAGKSTLLKILSRITPPSEGEIEITGRVSSLLEVGTGFHPELTGRDNIYMNGTIHGMRKWEIFSKLDEIIAFSGIEKYIDTPVKFYSSGMKVRLGFAVAAHLEPEILIIDEVVAVGDVEFQKKCIGKMKDVAISGRTVLFVSHDMGAIKNLCPESIILKQGRIFDQGESEQTILKYIDDLSATIANKVYDTTDFHIKEIKVQGIEVKQKCVIRNRQRITVEIMVQNHNVPKDITFGLDISNGFGVSLIHLRSDGHSRFQLESGINKIGIDMEYIPLLSGNYHVNFWIAEYKGKRIFEWEDLIVFEFLPINSFNDMQGHQKGVLLMPDAIYSVNEMGN